MITRITMMHLIGRSLLALVLLSAPAVASASTSSPEWMYPFDSDPTAAKQPFSSGLASGYIKYRSMYEHGTLQPMIVYVQLKAPERLLCMGVTDFKFDLTNRAGTHFTNSTDVTHWGQPIPQFIVIPSRTEPGQRPACPYSPRLDARFPLPIGELYPHLAPGTYRLLITFSPQDGSIPATPLPAISFDIQ
jgi:hypothetical protein